MYSLSFCQWELVGLTWEVEFVTLSGGYYSMLLPEYDVAVLSSSLFREICQ